MSVIAKVAAMLRAGDGVTCTWPGSGDMMITLERRMVDDAIAQWTLRDDEAGRERAMTSIRKAIKRANKHIERGTMTQKGANDMASDIALFLGHELMFSDGEKWLVKTPDASAFTEGGE